MYKETIKLDKTKYKDFSVVTTEPEKKPKKKKGSEAPKAGRKVEKNEARTSKWLEKRRKKRKRRIKILGITALILILAFMAAYFLFVIKTVRVTGNEIYEDEVISEMVLSKRYSWNSLYVYLTTKFLPGEKMPFIDTVEVSLKSPTSIEINVFEKPTIGCIYVEGTGQYAYFDKDGMVCELSSDLMENVPRIYGITCFETDLYDTLELEDPTILKTLLLLVVDLDKYDIPSDEISFQRSNIILQYDDVTVNLGRADKLTEKLMRLPKILPEVEGMTGTLHMETWSEENRDVVFKKETL